MSADTDPILIGRTWHFADGATLPLVAGGSDTFSVPGPPAGGDLDVEPDFDRFGDDGGTGDEGQPPPPSQPPSGQQPPAGGQPAPGTPEPPPRTNFATVEEAVAELGKVRQDTARYRTQLREYETHFGGLHPDDRSTMAEFVNHYRQGNDAGMMGWLVENARVIAQKHGTTLEQFLGGAPAPPAGQQPPPAGGTQQPPRPKFDPSDPDQFEKAIGSMLDQRFETYTTQQREQQLREQATNNILSKFQAANIDPHSPEGQYALFLIQEHKDIDTALTKLDEYKQQMAQDYAQRKQEQRRQHATTAPGGGGTQASGDDDVPDDVKEKGPLAVAEHRMNRRLDGIQRPRRAP
jgi:hypothetical protein